MAALFVAGLALAALGTARAASTHTPVLEVTLIQATAGDAGLSIDTKLKELTPATVRQAPFVRYSAYRLLQRQPLPLLGNQAVTLLLPNGRTLQAILTGVSSVSVDGGPVEKRYQLEAQIVGSPDAGPASLLLSVQVTVSANEPFFVGGQSYQGGTMFIALNVRP